MPEGPELHLAARFVNKACCSRFFGGKVIKSAVSTRNPDVEWDEEDYSIRACARGKELKMTLMSKAKNLDVILRFGMSGKFAFGSVDDVQKHSHLNFFTKTENKVLSFVDYRRFGKWEPGGGWGADRGPCVITEYDAFRVNVLDNLEKAAFNRPICEALLNQTFFNGIGNYLRAEVLFRCRVAPFTCARDVLEPLKGAVKSEKPDLLELCNLLPHEVLNLHYDPEDVGDHSSFSNWLQCYYNPQMKSLADHNNRTIWFDGETGPMAPKDKKAKHQTRKKNVKTESKDLDDVHSYAKKPRKMTRKEIKDLEIKNKEEIKIEPETKDVKPLNRVKTRSQKSIMSPYFAESVSKRRKSKKKS